MHTCSLTSGQARKGVLATQWLCTAVLGTTPKRNSYQDEYLSLPTAGTCQISRLQPTHKSHATNSHQHIGWFAVDRTFDRMAHGTPTALSRPSNLFASQVGHSKRLNSYLDSANHASTDGGISCGKIFPDGCRTILTGRHLAPDNPFHTVRKWYPHSR